MTVAIVVLFPVPAKPVNKTGVFDSMHSMIESNATCCLVVSFMFQISQMKKPFFLLGEGGRKLNTQQAKKRFFHNFNKSNTWPSRYSLDAVIMVLFLIFV